MNTDNVVADEIIDLTCEAGMKIEIALVPILPHGSLEPFVVNQSVVERAVLRFAEVVEMLADSRSRNDLASDVGAPCGKECDPLLGVEFA